MMERKADFVIVGVMAAALVLLLPIVAAKAQTLPPPEPGSRTTFDIGQQLLGTPGADSGLLAAVNDNRFVLDGSYAEIEGDPVLVGRIGNEIVRIRRGETIPDEFELQRLELENSRIDRNETRSLGNRDAIGLLRSGGVNVGERALATFEEIGGLVIERNAAGEVVGFRDSRIDLNEENVANNFAQINAVQTELGPDARRVLDDDGNVIDIQNTRVDQNEAGVADNRTAIIENRDGINETITRLNSNTEAVDALAASASGIFDELGGELVNDDGNISFDGSRIDQNEEVTRLNQENFVSVTESQIGVVENITGQEVEIRQDGVVVTPLPGESTAEAFRRVAVEALDSPEVERFEFSVDETIPTRIDRNEERSLSNRADIVANRADIREVDRQSANRDAAILAIPNLTIADGHTFGIGLGGGFAGQGEAVGIAAGLQFETENAHWTVSGGVGSDTRFDDPVARVGATLSF